MVCYAPRLERPWASAAPWSAPDAPRARAPLFLVREPLPHGAGYRVTAGEVEEVSLAHHDPAGCADAAALPEAEIYTAALLESEVCAAVLPESDGDVLDALEEEIVVLSAHIHAATKTSRRLCCDASVVRLTKGADGSILDVGRRTRTIPPALRRALEARDRGCRFPGCGSRFTDAHHVIPWAAGGDTSLGNCVLLCKYHHRLVHEGGWTVDWWGEGRPVFYDPRGGVHCDVRGEAPARGEALPKAPILALHLFPSPGLIRPGPGGSHGGRRCGGGRTPGPGSRRPGAVRA
jgi:hypothetical protein